MLRRLVTIAAVLGSCVTPAPRPVTPEPEPVEEVRPLRVVAPPREPGIAGLYRDLLPLRSVPDNPGEVPAEARPYLRALRAGLRAWLLEEVTRAGRVPPRAVLRAALDHAELTTSRAGDDVLWGAVTRIDVMAPGDDLSAVVLGLRLSCTSDDALYVFQGPRLVMELAQDQWADLTDARGDLRVTQSRAARTDGALLVSSRAQRCFSRWQFVRFEGMTEGATAERPTMRWDLRHPVDITGECGGFDDATLGVELSRNGFELRGCSPSGEGAAEPRATRARYRYTHEGIEAADERRR